MVKKVKEKRGITETRFSRHTLCKIQTDDDNFAIVVVSEVSQSHSQADRHLASQSSRQ